MATLYDVLGWEDIPLEEKCAMLTNMWGNADGKYVGYFTTFESSAIGFSDILEVLKGTWCFGMVLFENNGLTKDKLKELFPNPDDTPRGTVLNYFTKNLKEIYRHGHIFVPKAQ